MVDQPIFGVGLCWFSTPPARAPGFGAAPRSSAMRIDPGVQDRRRHERGQTRLDLERRCRLRAQELVMVGEMPVERSTQLLLLTWTGVDSKNGSTADQGRTGRKDSSSRLWRPARSLGTHAKQSPSTGHSAVGLRQAGKSLLTPRPHFTAPSCTPGNQVVGASDGSPFRQESRPTGVCRTPVAGSGSAISEPLRVGAGVF